MLCLHMTSNRKSHLSSTINISMSIAEAPTLPANGTRRSSSSSPGSRITSLGLKHNTWFLSPKFQISSRKYLKRAPRPINPQTPLFKTSPRGVSAYIPSIYPSSYCTDCTACAAENRNISAPQVFALGLPSRNGRVSAKK